MPREFKKRGRREAQKRKAQDESISSISKRTRVEAETQNDVLGIEVHGDAGDDFIKFEDAFQSEERPHFENQFYGLLDEHEQAYYASVNNKLSANDFESPEDQAMFLQAIHRETRGKELKVASSQSCSRYLEKIILLSTPDQLRSLFSAFLENLTYLVQHRFASHCCEALFKASAKHIKADRRANDSEANLEDLFTQAVEQLEPHLGFLITDRFATHCVRVLLAILAGEDIDQSLSKMVASRKKEKVELPSNLPDVAIGKQQIPKSFTMARERLITAAFAGLDTSSVRALATHPTGNPFLQLVLKVELTLYAKSKDKALQLLYPNLFPDEELELDSETGKFIQGLLYDPTGSHIVEILVQYLPGKQFKKLYANILKDRMRNLAKNDVASFIASRVLERLGKDDLVEACNFILPEVSNLIDRLRFGLIRTLFERLVVRQADSQDLVDMVFSACGNDPIALIPKLLQFNTSIDTINNKEEAVEMGPGRANIHGSLLGQAMLQDPKACEIIQQSFLAQPPSILLLMAKNSIASRLVQAVLVSEHGSMKFRRQAIPKFYGMITDLAGTASGSYVIDILWNATTGLHFVKEKIAQELAQNEKALRDSFYGRNVWRTWSMDKYLRRRGEWNAMAKGHISTDRSDTIATEDREHPASDTSAKSAIQLARERYAKVKDREGRPQHAKRTSVVTGA